MESITPVDVGFRLTPRDYSIFPFFYRNLDHRCSPRLGHSNCPGPFHSAEVRMMKRSPLCSMRQSRSYLGASRASRTLECWQLCSSHGRWKLCSMWRGAFSSSHLLEELRTASGRAGATSARAKLCALRSAARSAAAGGRWKLYSMRRGASSSSLPPREKAPPPHPAEPEPPRARAELRAVRSAGSFAPALADGSSAPCGAELLHLLIC